MKRKKGRVEGHRKGRKEKNNNNNNKYIHTSSIAERGAKLMGTNGCCVTTPEMDGTPAGKE